MPECGRPEQKADDGVATDAKRPCLALVPMVQSARWSLPRHALPPANSTFVTHLIATAERLPQTRSLRRGTHADAQTAYRAHPLPRAGIWTRQSI